MKRRKGETLEEYYERVEEGDREDGVDSEGSSLEIPGLNAAVEAGVRTAMEGVGERVEASIDSKVTEARKTKPEDPGGSGQSREDRLVSRNQPTTPLYRTLHRAEPSMIECRTPDLDYWNTRWLQSWMVNNHAEMARCQDKLAEASGRNARATTALVGDLDVSDPTAITDGTGGSLLPQEFAEPALITRDAKAKMAPLCQSFVMNGPTLRVPMVANVAAATRAEGVAPTALIPVATSAMLIAHNISVFMKLSKEMIADSPFNVVNIYTEVVGKGIAKEEDIQILTTNGTTPNFTGALVGAAVSEPTSTQADWPMLTKLYRAVSQTDRDGAVWLSGSDVLTLLDNLEDGGGHPILFNPGGLPSAVGDGPGNEGTIKRHKVYEVPVPTGIIIFGDCKGYSFARRAGLTIDTGKDVGPGLIEILIEERADGVLTDPGRLKQSEGLII